MKKAGSSFKLKGKEFGDMISWNCWEFSFLILRVIFLLRVLGFISLQNVKYNLLTILFFFSSMPLFVDQGIMDCFGQEIYWEYTSLMIFMLFIKPPLFFQLLWSPWVVCSIYAWLFPPLYQSETANHNSSCVRHRVLNKKIKAICSLCYRIFLLCRGNVCWVQNLSIQTLPPFPSGPTVRRKLLCVGARKFCL